MNNRNDSDQQISAKREQNKTALWQSVLISVVSVAIFFTLLEGGLAVLGVNPALQSKDPFVGFVSNVPLFVEKTDTDGQKIMATANNKLSFFNPQEFTKEKAPGTYRIFSLGGSTTYGRPYDDTTSFTGWLRELLPVADPQQKWEVINAGGISYASYRVANLMKELVRYEPDLFIIYSGHNEFLEERTYGTMRNIPDIIKSTTALLARSRTWTAISSALKHLNALPNNDQGKKTQLSGEVNTLLSRSAGLDRYKRDNALRDKIMTHYRISLERMVKIARAAGAEVIFVTPASNLKDSSPFKSQHTDGIVKANELKSEELLTNAIVFMQKSEWSEALESLEKALAIDPEYSELHYRRGKTLFALDRHDEAFTDFIKARDNDVCPLRALSPMQDILAEFARDKRIKLVDFINIIEKQTLVKQGHRIPGREYFLDHVHPTIKGNRILAAELVRAMIEKGIVRPSASWGEQAIEDVALPVEESLDLKTHAQALVNLARVMNWAGKSEDAERLAGQALESGVEDPEIVAVAAGILATLSERQGNIKQALQYFQNALKTAPKSPELHFQIGLLFMNKHTRNFEVAAAHILFASTFWPDQDMVNLTLGLSMAERKRYAPAYTSIREALRLNPRNMEAKSALSRLSKLVMPEAQNNAQPKVTLKEYPSGAVQTITQVKLNKSGRYIPDGILTDWYESGDLKHLVDYDNGVMRGIEVKWDPDGHVISQKEYR